MEDLHHRQVITVADVRRAHGSLTVTEDAIITPSARDLAASLGIQFVPQTKAHATAASAEPALARKAFPAMTACDLAARIDHTNLAPAASADDIERLCDEAVRLGVAAVCVHPTRVTSAAARLRGTAVAVCGVVGFPSGAHETAVKELEAARCVQGGAVEIDMVANCGLLRDGKVNCYHADIRAVRAAIGAEIVLKVIVEAPLLSSADVVRAATIAAAAGADFVKTSTGVYANARVEDIVLLRRALPPGAKIKAAGGIRSSAQALALLAAGADRLGTSASLEIVQELRQSPPGV